MTALTLPASALPYDPSSHTVWTSRWAHSFTLLLAGYALFNRGFAYLGYPPVYVGEIVLAAGILLLLTSRRWLPVLAHPASVFACLFFLWGALRTLPYIDQYGLFAMRDAVIWGYAVWAILVGGIVLAYPPLLPHLIHRFRLFIPVFLLWIPTAHLLSRLLGDSLPHLPISDVPLLVVKGGDSLVHCTGILAFLLAGCGQQFHPLVVLLLPLNLLVNGSINRGGFLAFVAGVIVAFCFRPKSRWIAPLFLAGLLFSGAFWALNTEIEIPGTERTVSVEQIFGNVQSLVGAGGTQFSDGTREWRQAWWLEIIEYTFTGPYFWTGKGFGLNLADDDGFQVLDDGSLRSPHNGHLTVLARTGVPGLALWALLQIAWVGSLLSAHRRARLASQRRWAGLFVFLIVYWTAFMVNATFDVFFEGPMGGIWFWSLFGVGIAASLLHRQNPQILSDDDPAFSSPS